ncbi:UvrD-helicase domain-containing protein [Mycobacteroides abscessus]|uniref:UvrD-helicase domain-containing protein n=2 Tax=Mycobacteroides abscessus TaxID=36809 RepID=UPI0009A6ADA3|nr:UvrD-helicase domain-containing protein [Mycobacteroides abscessus]SLH44005.1 DNA/RNA helicase, superfamily I [Mycobacteroides abscessus subsp. massiliense]
MEPTDEQLKILDAARTLRSVVIQAGAGTGKTSTFLQLAEARKRNSIYISYNRSIADEARGRFPRHVRCTTTHGLAYRFMSQEHRGRLESKVRQRSSDAAQILGIVDLELTDTLRVPGMQLARIALEAVDRFCYSSDYEITTAHIPYQNAITGDDHDALATVVLRYARRAWEDIVDPAGRLRFVPDHYLKMWALTDPVLRTEVIMLDEAQDSNPLIANLVRNQSHAQQIICGDSNQSMYEWRGAVDALAQWEADAVLYLSKSWRFGPAIAEEANKWLARIGTPLRLSGNPAINSHVGRLDEPTAVLCRTNAGAMKNVLSRLNENRKVALVGKGAELQQLIRAAADLKSVGRTNHPELFTFKSWGALQDYVENDPGGRDLKPFVDMVDAHGVEELQTAVDALVPEDSADTIVSTAHRAKGRQWESVKISDDYPDGANRRDDHRKNNSKSEAMIAYVAVTRAQQLLDRGGLSWIDQHTVNGAHRPTALQLDQLAAAPVPAKPADQQPRTASSPKPAAERPPTPTQPSATTQNPKPARQQVSAPRPGPAPSRPPGSSAPQSEHDEFIEFIGQLAKQYAPQIAATLVGLLVVAILIARCG